MSEKKQSILLLLGNRTDLICDFLYERSYEEIEAILALPYWTDDRFKYLLTSNIWKSSAREITEIIEMKIDGKSPWEDLKFAPLLTPTIWNSNPQNVRNILEMKEWNENKYRPLLTPSIWLSSYKNIATKLHMSVWDKPIYEKLLTPSIFGLSVNNIEGNIKLFEEYKIEAYIVTRSLRKNPIDQRLLIEYLIENDIPLIVKDKLNPILNVSRKELKEQYGIDYDVIMSKGKSRAK